MKKSLLIALVVLFSTISAQDSKIDFRTVDIKYLNQQQLREFQRWRDEQFRMMKSAGLQSEIKSLVIQGNKIKSIIYNTGAISNPGVTGNIDLFWSGLGYGYEFGPLVGSRVPKASDQDLSNSDIIVSFDSLKLGLVNNIVSKSVKLGDTIEFKVVIRNNDINSISNIVVKDTMRYPLELVGQSSIAGAITSVDSIVTYSNTSLSVGASDTITIRARILPTSVIGKQVVNKAYAQYNNSNFISSSFTAIINNNFALSTVLNINSTSFKRGDTIRYVITVSNISSTSPLINVAITDTLRFPLKLVSKTSTSGTVISKDSIVSYVNTQISAGSTASITILARIDTGNYSRQNLNNRYFASAERFSIDSVNIVIDGFGGANKSTADGDFAPDGITKWGWLPKSGYAAPGQNNLASWGARSSDPRVKPKSWPESWYNSVLGVYKYPSFLGDDQTTPDEEVYYIVDDSTDAEFDYYPFVNDVKRRGLGLNLEVRTFQFANPLAEDIVFLVYTAENDIRSKNLPKVFFGMFGDPHIGGANNYADDAASFIPARTIGIPDFDKLIVVDGKTTSQLSRNLVYSWDPDGKSDIATIPTGYFGYKFLESPNNSHDGIDNDDDGLKDEDPLNDKGTFIDGINVPLTTGIFDTTKYKALYGAPKPRWSGDEDGDWDKDKDDVGVDGIFGTGDFGEGNGVPDQLIVNGEWKGSEPNFGFRDVSESDQIGLRSFWSLAFGGNNRPKNDNLMYNSMSSEMDTAALALLWTTNPENIGDFIFLYGSGPFEMDPGHRERFSIALLMGSDLKDLLLNSETAQLVLQANYRFAQPPPKPRVIAVPGDGRVTLYWDNAAENTTDPFSGKKDFEGYKIYRSQDYTFKDVFSITDGNGYPFLGKALYDEKARKTAQWHRPWTKAEQDKYVGGFHPVEYRGRFIRYYMGEPSDTSGLHHQYVDSTVTNGKQYYYAVVSFDHGDDSLQLPPTESQSIIQRDAVTQEFKFDVNTVAVTPNKFAVGIVNPNDVMNQNTPNVHLSGAATGNIEFKVMNELKLTDAVYRTTFAKIKSGTDSVMAFSVYRVTPVVENITGNETFYSNLTNGNISLVSVKVYSGTDTFATVIPSSQLSIDSASGRIRANITGVLKKDIQYTVAYTYYPIINSSFLQNQDGNLVFDGLRPFIGEDTLKIDGAGSVFTPAKPNGITATVARATVGTDKTAPVDIKIIFQTSTADTNANGDYNSPVDSIGSSTNPFAKVIKIPFRILNGTDTTTIKAFIKDSPGPKAKLGRWDFGEEIVILTPPPYQQVATNTMMGILITRTDSSKSINGGTTFTARMKKPFTTKDAYEFNTKSLRYNESIANAGLNNVFVVPNPYVVSSQFEEPSNITGQRGPRAIQFRNLPRECTIRIYTVTGELVQTIHKNDNNSFFNWDVLSSESARIAYGVYIFHVETPNGGTKIGRFGIIK